MIKKLSLIIFALVPHLLFSQITGTNFSIVDFSNASKAITITFFFQGAFFVMALYMYLLYFQFRKKDYLFYSIYLTVFFVYFHLRINSVLRFNLVLNDLNLQLHLLLPILLIATAIYIKFIIVFAEIDKYDKPFVKQLNIFSYISYFVAVIVLSYTLLTNDFDGASRIRPMIMLPLHIYTLYALIRAFIVVKSNLRYYILFSNMFLYIFSVIGVYSAKGLSFMEDINSHFLFGFYSFNASQLGVFLEMIGFSLGLGYKFSLIENEKNEVKEKYIEQLKENELVTVKLNKELSKLVEVRTQEIEAKNKLLIKEQRSKLKSDFNEKLIKSELASLRARMNPHFIFNSLNSIKSFIIINDVKNSVSYFSKFAKLLRYSLNNSSTDFVNLNDEITFLKDYVVLENLRLSNPIDFIIKVPKELESKSPQIPPLIIQPFLENAIWHGLSRKIEFGILTLEIKTNVSFLEIHIIDNGIGRVESSKKNINKTFKSKGISLTAERLEIFSKLYKLKKSFEIIDLKDDLDKALGTHVIIKLPLLYNKDLRNTKELN